MSSASSKINALRFQAMLTETVESRITRVELNNLSKIQRNKILNTRRLQNILLEAQTPAELKIGLSTIKWHLVQNAKSILYASGCSEVWDQSPLSSWMERIDASESVPGLEPAFSLSFQNPSEPIWLINALLAEFGTHNMYAGVANHFVEYLISKGISGDTQIASTAFGGVERNLKLHDIILVYYQNTKNSNWQKLKTTTTWGNSSHVEDTLFALFSNLSDQKMSAEEKEWTAKRLPPFPINWGREFNMLNTMSQPHPVTLASLIFSECVRNGTPTTKRLKKIYTQALYAISLMDVGQQQRVMKDILMLTERGRSGALMTNFVEKCKDILPIVNPAVQQMCVSTLLGEFICTHHKDMTDLTHQLFRAVPKDQRTGFDVTHLQLMHANIHNFISRKTSNIPYHDQISGSGLYHNWKVLRSYMTPQALQTVNSVSESLLTLFTPADVKEWIENFNLQVNIKKQLMENAPSVSKRKI